MHPVLRRILLHGGLTAGTLALIGMMFAELAGLWLTGSATRSSADPDEEINTSLRSRIPFTMALWGFGFVAVSELVIWRVRGNRPATSQQTGPQTEQSQDEAEKLLNELLAQAEAKMALEAESQKAEDRKQNTESEEQKTEDKEQNRG
ncbi:hypothetical protein VT84_28955 [Gemmata sp. SH-PL17]|uniref:hypothetical protein n=1 Tax=Gemmata sp. SH-PL17 TaxID=1630693 RepID=UPI0004BCE9B4|nr:hypothetical protein [Gemmata sp. SH-PL17]AMV28469.1 hypothetical protein VT84_28955 [Gemmata sp. SH-PL17]